VNIVSVSSAPGRPYYAPVNGPWQSAVSVRGFRAKVSCPGRPCTSQSFTHGIDSCVSAWRQSAGG